MNHEHDDNKRTDSSEPNFWRTRSGITLGVLGAIAGFLLISEHQAHLFDALPFLLLGGCIVMHLFMHGGHGGHGSHSEAPKVQSDEGGQDGDTSPVKLVKQSSTNHGNGQDS